ncbi:MAG: hypothetical protein M3R38_35585, partial [Actinomycetota bacterium]|nr:hypothetical protein [Actinomycetota bacterium]
ECRALQARTAGYGFGIHVCRLARASEPAFDRRQETEKVLATSSLGTPRSTAASTLILGSFE